MTKQKILDWTPAGERQLVEFLRTAEPRDDVLILSDDAGSILVSATSPALGTFYVYDDAGDFLGHLTPDACLDCVRDILGPPRSEGEA